MKRSLLISVLIILTLNVFSQNLDSYGIPTELNRDADFQTNYNMNRTISDVSEAEVPKVIGGFSLPVNFSTGLAFDGELLWVSGYAEYNLYGMNPETGEVEEIIPIDFIRPYGLTYNDGRFYIVNNDSKEIIEVDRYTGEVVNVNVLSQEGNVYPTGVEVINGEIWYNDPQGPYAYSSPIDLTIRLNPETEHNASGGFPTALAFDGNYLWSIDNEERLIHQVNKQDFSSGRTIQAPGGIYPNGLAFDGEFMWVSNNESDSIYKISIEPEVNTSVLTSNNENEIRIYPSISNYTFNIDLGNLQTEEVKIELISIDGHTVGVIDKVYQSQLRWVNKNELAEGLYFFKISYRNEIITKKVIIKK